MSTGIWRSTFPVEAPDLADVERARRALALLRNDLWYADIQVFDAVYDGERAAHAFVVHRRALAQMIERFEIFWTPYGITPSTHPSEVIAIVDRMPRDDRWRGYGYLFGYPADAVDFFVTATRAAAERAEAADTNEDEHDDVEATPERDRDFVQLPTYAMPTGRFTYAVPIGHRATLADTALANAAAEILVAYTAARSRGVDALSLLSELRRLNHRFESLATSAVTSSETQVPP